MADFKDTVQQLLDHPGVRYGASDSPASMVWVEQETLPREEFGTDIESNTLTRTHNAISFPAVNDEEMTFSIDGETYSVRTSVDENTVTVSAVDFRVVASVLSTYTEAQNLSVIVAAMRQLPNITPKVISGDIVIFNDTDRTADVVGAGSLVTGTSTASLTDSGLYFPKGYRPGDRWAKNEYMVVLQSWVTGGEDTHHNVSVVLRADLQRLSDDFDDFTFPDDLAGDHYTVSYPYDGESREIIWRFQVASTGSYTRAPAGTPHPLYPETVLVGVQEGSEDGTLTVSHTYRRIGPAAEQHKQGYSVSYECSTGADETARFPVVTLRLEVLLSGFVPAVPGAVCPIDGTNAGTQNAELDFQTLDLKLREPPELETRGSVYGVVTMRYSRLPSWPSTVRKTVAFPEGAELFETTLFVEVGWTPPSINDAAGSIAGSDYTASYVTNLTEVPLGCGVYRAIIEHAKVPASFSHYSSEGFNFPPLYPAAVTYPPSSLPFSGGRVGWAESVPSKITYSFTRTPETLVSSMPESIRFESFLMMAVQNAIQEQDLTEEEVAESISRYWWAYPNILHDTFLIEDPKTGSIVVTSTPSRPSASLYRTWVQLKSWMIVRDVLSRWKGGIHMRIKVEIKAR